MSHVQRMVETNPSPAPVDTAPLAECIEACLDCADLCAATGSILSRQTAFEPEVARAALEACSQACWRYGEECDQHAEQMEHCRVCAEVCRRCESACNNLLSALGA